MEKYIIQSISELTEKTPTPSGNTVKAHGLGQVIKKVTISDAYTIEFCSKWTTLSKGRLMMMRRIDNCICNSIVYTGRDEELTNNPKKHSWLVGNALCNEAGSTSAQYIGAARIRMGVEPSSLHKAKYKRKHSRGMNVINDKTELYDEMRVFEKFTGHKGTVLLSFLFQCNRSSEIGTTLHYLSITVFPNT